MTDLEDKMSKNFAGVQNRIDEISERINDLEKNVNDLEKNLKPLRIHHQ